MTRNSVGIDGLGRLAYIHAPYVMPPLAFRATKRRIGRLPDAGLSGNWIDDSKAS